MGPPFQQAGSQYAGSMDEVERLLSEQYGEQPPATTICITVPDIKESVIDASVML
jgi:hypothetical protein